MRNEIFLETVKTTEYERPATGTSWVRSATILKSDRKLTPTARDVYDVLLDMCTEANNIIRISYNQLKKRVFCCRKSVYNALNRLHECGYIDRLPKAWRTETNTFEVFKILPDKKRSRSAEDKQPDNIPEIQSRPKKARKPRAEKPDMPEKKRYGKYSLVALTDDEYTSLVNDFGQEITTRYIQSADNYSKKQKRKKPYDNNAETIRVWIEEDRDNPDRRHNYHRNDENKDNKITDEELAGYTKLAKRFPGNTPYRATNVFTDEEMAGYLRLVNRFREDVLEPISTSEPVSKPESEEYEMTDEEIAQILDCWDTDIIYDTYYRDSSHPLCHCSVGELMVIAERQRKRRNTS